MAPDISIRRCTIADAPALSVLAQRTFYDTFTGTCTEADMHSFLQEFYNEPRLAAELADASNPVFFAEINDVPAGYIRFGDNPVPFPDDTSLKALEIGRLYVDKAFHRTGIAQRLMQVYLDFAAANDYRLLWLGVWEHNHRAQRFYAKYGFSFTGNTHPFPIADTPQTDEWWSCILP